MFSLDEITRVIVIIYALAGLLYFGGLFLKRGRVVTKYATMFLAAFFLFNMYALSIKSNGFEQTAVMLKATDAKFEPTESGNVHFKLSEGMKVVLIAKEGQWVKIKREDGKLGWIAEESMAKVLPFL